MAREFGARQFISRGSERDNFTLAGCIMRPFPAITAGPCVGWGQNRAPDSGDDIALGRRPILHCRAENGRVAKPSVHLFFLSVWPGIDLCIRLLLRLLVCHSAYAYRIPTFAIWIRLLHLLASRSLTSRADSALPPPTRLLLAAGSTHPPNSAYRPSSRQMVSPFLWIRAHAAPTT